MYEVIHTYFPFRLQTLPTMATHCSVIFHFVWLRILIPVSQFRFVQSSTSRISCSCHLQVLSELDIHLYRGKFEQSRAQTLTHAGLPSGAVGPTMPSRLPDRDLVRADNLVGNIGLESKMVSVSAINSRNLKGAACDEGYTSISISSTAVFPGMEGCYSLLQNGGPPLYSKWNALIYVFQLSNDDVSICW